MPEARGAGLAGPVVTAAWLLALFGVPLFLLLAPPVTFLGAAAFGAGERTGLGERVAAREAERARAFVTGARVTLPAEVDGRPGFGADEASHLADVRAVLRDARLASLAALALAVAWTAVSVRCGRRRMAGAAMSAGAWTLLGLCAAALAFALVDFDAFFASFHGLLFANGTWMFPEDSLLIQLFPTPFWMAAGALWAALSLFGAAGLLLGGLALARSSAD